MFLSAASICDGASLSEEDDKEQVEEFDFDDWDDTREDMSNHTTEVSDLVKANKLETQAQDAARQDVNIPTGPWLKGKNSLYQQCTSSSGKEHIVNVNAPLQLQLLVWFKVFFFSRFGGQRVTGGVSFNGIDFSHTVLWRTECKNVIKLFRFKD